MKILRDVRAARRAVTDWATAGERIALVPTMGNLHDGHISLVTLARRHADRVVASIFVNPTQFGPHEDYAQYPRTLAADKTRLRGAGADALFMPTVASMYPRGDGRSTVVSVPQLSTELCGAFRPGHFDGVASVVLRLFHIVSPGIAVFGEKDYQQLTVLRQMTADLHLPIRLIGGRTVRENDGLAMSSRNQYLGTDERAVAPELHATLQACRVRILAGDGAFRAIERQAGRALYRAGFRPDYVAIRDADDLSLPTPRSRNLRILAAAWLGRARLIDNIPVRLR
jgi:pantoate--beta-alanine ligase